MGNFLKENIRFKRVVSAEITLFWCICIFLVASGCSFFGQNDDDIVLIRVGDKKTTVGEFKSALEITKSAYSHNVLQEDKAFQEAKLRLLNQITEEMIILERADELGTTVSNSELEKAVKKIKEDYPEDVFEEMLLENAITYASWKERLRIRLVIQKTIEEEVESKVEITPEDISEYYKARRKKEELDTENQDIEKESEEMIVKELRRRKAELKYQQWIKELQERYTTEINDEAFEKIAKM